MADDDAGGGGGGSANTQPWGRFKCVSKHPATESDHLNFTLRHHRIGRSGFSADIHIDSGFISKRHCEITLDTTSGEPVVTLLDLSSNGVYLNEVLVGKGNSAVVEPNITVHFTRPGFHSKKQEPIVYKFELLMSERILQNMMTERADAAAPASPLTSAPAPAPAPAAAAAPTPTHELPATQTTQPTAVSPTPDVDATVRRGSKRSVAITDLDADAAARGSSKRPAAGANLDARSARAAVADPPPPRGHRSGLSTATVSKDRKLTPPKTARPSPSPSPSPFNLDRDVVTARPQQAAGVAASSESVASAAATASGGRRGRGHGGVVSSGESEYTAEAARAEELEARLREATARAEHIGKQLSGAEAEILALTDELEKCFAHGKQLGDELALKNAELEARAKALTNMTTEFLAMKAQLHAADQKAALHDAEMAELEERNKGLEAQLKSAGTTLKPTNTMLDLELLRMQDVGSEDADAARIWTVAHPIARAAEQAYEVFADVHERMQREAEELRRIPRLAATIATRSRAAPPPGTTARSSLLSTAEFAEHLPSDTALSVPSSDQSPLPAEYSDDMRSADQVEAAGANSGAASPQASAQRSVVIGSADGFPQLQQASSDSQDADESDAHPDGSEGGPTPPNRNDSEDSVLSGHSSSRTPPAKPLRVPGPAPMRAAAVAAVPDPEEVAAVDRDDEKKASESVSTGPRAPESGSTEHIENGDGAGSAVEGVAAAGTTKEPSEEKEDGDKPTSEGDEKPAGAASRGGDDKEAHDETPKTSGTVDADADAREESDGAGSGSAGAATELQQPEPPQRWLPTVTHDESLNSQANESTGIFDDETQFSQ